MPKILVNNIPAVKAGQEISEADEVNVIEDFKYVSRAGYKLEKAIEDFKSSNAY